MYRSANIETGLLHCHLSVGYYDAERRFAEFSRSRLAGLQLQVHTQATTHGYEDTARLPITLKSASRGVLVEGIVVDHTLCSGQ
jgi:hypothetical protein